MACRDGAGIALIEALAPVEKGQMADRYIAEDRGDDLDAFIAWARDNAGPSDPVDETSEQSAGESG